MRGKLEVGANAWRAQLLSLLQQRGQAQKALALFTPEASASVRTAGALTASPLALKLLSSAVESRRSEWSQVLAVERDPKRQRVSDGSKNDAVFAAKLAQSIVKTYASTSAAAVKEAELEDLVVALDLACVALYVACALEHAVRLGDLVVDNLLYQVAKKYAEIPSMRVAASCVAACIHVRLWNAHATVCKASGGDIAKRSQLMVLLDQDDDCTSRVMQQFELVAAFPDPMGYHSEQFTRLLLGHVNTCVTLLVADKNPEAVLIVADSTLSRWIDHLQKLPGQNSKLASSFSDRTFRILWKCAAVADGAKQKSAETASTALRFRSTALTFLLKCSNYTALYFIQQVHRVGVQHERVTNRSQRGLQEVYAFYAREANDLSQAVPDAPHMYTSESLQWEYLNWIEHFTSITDLSGMHLRSAMILESAVHYVELFGSTGTSIQACLLFSIAGVLFNAADSTKGRVCLSSESGRASAAFAERLIFCTGKLVRELAHNTESSKWHDQCEKAARVHLKKLEALTPYSFVELGSRDHVLFLMRCIKRSSTKIFNYAIGVQDSQKNQLYKQVVTCFGNICKAVRELRSSATLTDIKAIETLILEESRLHRMAVMLSVRCCRAASSNTAKPALHTISQHVGLVRELLDYAMIHGKPSESILQGILGDLNSIARECYTCASSCYKEGRYQDTISALVGAFELAESYLEYVMCSKLSIEDIHKAHAQLKVDAIASLLAHCFRELGNVTKSREFNGYSLLYCGDIFENTPQASVNKYVSCILEELTSSGVDMKSSTADVFKTFVGDASHVYKSRHIPEKQILLLWHTFRSAFERMSAKIAMNLRASASDAPDFLSYNTVELCCMIENHLDGVLMSFTNNTMDCNDILLEVARTLAKRKLLFCAYYQKRDFNSLIEGLLHTHRSLSAAAENLKDFTDKSKFDLGGVYGWRGVITMEIALIDSYAGTTHCLDVAGEVLISEEKAITGIERCLLYWGARDSTSGYLFDGSHVITCLESVCNTLSLVSCSAAENEARTLLKTFWVSENIPCTASGGIPPLLLGLLGTMTSNDASIERSQAIDPSGDRSNGGVLGFEQVDKAITAARVSHYDGSTVQACQNLQNAVTILSELKLTMRQRSTATMVKAIGMRELLVHTILSDIHFREGRSTCAIIETKSALRICWKMSKKFTAASSTAEAAYFDLPSELSTTEWQQQKSAHLLYFMALESSSWDLLYAAKLSLCRLASLYCYSDQPHRAASYLIEAMRLVGGLNLHLFRRTPFYEYAELELNASHLEKAKTAISLLSNSRTEPEMHDVDTSGSLPRHHPCVHSDWAFIEQICNEMVQQGDVHAIEGDKKKALCCYLDAIKSLSAFKHREASDSSALTRVHARCWRKYTRHQSEIIDLTDPCTVETLLDSMKTLKRMMKRCDSRVERAKCVLELGRINIKLLRSSSPRAFTSLDRTLALLEEAYLFGDYLGITHLSQELRTTLGMAYFAEIEVCARGDADRMDGGDRSWFLSWASSALLANASTINECEGGPSEPTDSDTDVSAKEALINQLKQLSARPGADQNYSPHKQIEEMARNCFDKVQQLPDTWVIVSLMIGLSSELVITRFPTNGAAPISFCLPSVSWKACIHEMDVIVQKSRNVLSGHTAKEADSWSSEQKKEWWDTRKKLDKRIEKSMRSMQETLGFWRCLLIKGTSTHETQCVRQCWDLLTSRKAGPVQLAERNQSLLCAIADAQQWLSDSEIVDGIRHIAAEIDAPLPDYEARKALQLLRKLGKRSESSPSQATHSSYLPKLEMDNIKKMKVSEVKQLLAAEGLRTDGLKKVLVERLIAARDAALLEALNSTLPKEHSAGDQGFSTILILNHQLQQFPWEGMDVMESCRGVTRMPSLDLILQNAKRVIPPTPTYSLIRRDRVRFLLNPAGDLKSTQNQLGPVLEGGVTTYGWEGVAGEVPDPDKLRNYLLAADLYIYCGHGSGEAYLHRDQVLSLKSGCSAALLFGCSSGRLEREGIFGPSGAVLAYLRAGSPAVLAMLWDVTDRDIDQLSVKILQDWLLNEDGNSSPSLARVLQDSRSVCKLKYLNGHAAVCYGLPLHVAKS